MNINKLTYSISNLVGQWPQLDVPAGIAINHIQSEFDRAAARDGADVQDFTPFQVAKIMVNLAALSGKVK